MRLAGPQDDAAEAAGFRKMVWVSLLLHGGAAAVFALGPLSFAEPQSLEFKVVEVRMVTVESPGQAPAPRPPKPEPPPPETKVVIPEELHQIEDPEPEPEPVDEEPEPEPEPREEPPPQETAPPDDHDLASALDALRSELGDPEPQDEPVDADAEPAVASTGTRLADPAVVRWSSQVKRKVRRSWVLAPGFIGQPLRTDVEVFLAADGSVKGVDIVRRSGNPWYDQSVERALRRSSPLPAPPESGTWPFSFTPEDAH